ncbi:SDR family NAD(P)-dependent oxidoreductase [Yoonia sp. SS1-5]|uniref:SDR family NAD(P)-dependent oxidoreductase n=1 Tax=Yoonia rhodophyticola TaxID=3137370 RepID=A0ABZ3JD22_9RHOB
MSMDGRENDIAIVGMAAHLPGADAVATYWQNLRDGKSAIRKLDEATLLEAGESPDRMRHRNYVSAAAMLDGFEMFDADFFGLSPKEAAIMDPQHRQFLEVSWEAFEDAGHPPETFTGPIGVFAGCGMGSYFYFNVCSNPDLVQSTGMFLLRHTGNDKDFLSTRVSHVFDLKGPSISMQTACSTSLVAAHYACQALLNGECDMALAGGVTIELPHGRGYIFEDGEILSPDGECHAFDHRAEGTVFGSGAGAVVLRRLEDAIADGDHIWAVIKGSAVNNDGSAKAGYLAPSVEGQAAAIAEAHAMAGVTADTIDYIECHGTGTYLGDPIEVAALTSAFRETTDETQFCKIGSVKTNIGHLDTAAGVASLVKTSMSLHHKQIPPSLGYEAPNPSIDFDNSPFSVNAELKDWTSHKGPRRAGVNSLGVGGTNAHVILEEAPERPASDESDWPFHILTISGRSKAALDANSAALAAHLRDNPDINLADVAFTLKEGRRAFEKRRVIVAETAAEAADILEEADPRRVFSHTELSNPDVVFMFPGGGAQYVNMARDLYETEPVFQDWMDQGLDILQPKLDYDIRALWLPEAGAEDAAAKELQKPSVQLPLIMITEYALAQLWMSWGVTPAAFVGHSMGENTAACLAGVMTFEDCIGLVHLRGQLFDTVPAGGMISVPLSLDDLQPFMADDLDVASVNAPGLTVLSGPQAALDALTTRLTEAEVESQRIQIDIAAHSRMLEPILDRFQAYLASIQLNAPQIPIISNRSGVELTDAEATDPAYWVAHLRNTVNFADCITTLSEKPNRIYIEVGPGKALSSLTQAHGAVPGQQVISTLRHPNQDIADDAYFISVFGRFWALGYELDWSQIWGEAKRHRLPLPTYAFQRNPYFIAPGTAETALAPASLPMRVEDVSDWAYRPVWHNRLPQIDVAVDGTFSIDGAPVAPQSWLIFMDEAGVGAKLSARLTAQGHSVTEVHAGDSFGRTADGNYVLAPERGREGYDQLIADLLASGRAPARIVHLWLVTAAETFRPGGSFFHRNQEQGFYSLMFLAQALSDESLPKPIHITAVTSGAASVNGEALPYPEKSTIMGPARVMPRELPGVTCAVVDVALPKGLGSRRKGRDGGLDDLAERLLQDAIAKPANTVAAYRGAQRLELSYQPAPFPQVETHKVRDGAVCLITGGFGGIGLTLAENLIQTRNAKIVLLSRNPLPDAADRAAYLRDNGPFDSISRRITAVQRLEALGAEVMTVAADVCNLEDMRAMTERVKDRFGSLDVVIHGAGVIADAPLLTKDQFEVEAVFAPKIHGTQVLNTLFPDGALDLMVVFASSSTVTAPAGQVDYVAANTFLNAFAQSRQGGKTDVVAINWGIWSEVGMAADAMAERLGTGAPAPALPVDAPLLDETTFDRDGNRIFTATYDVGAWIMDQHRTIDGQALLPGTGYLELITQALRAQGETGPFEISDLYFFRPLDVSDTGSRKMQLRLTRTEAGYTVTIQSDVRVGSREGFALNAQANIALTDKRAPAPLDIAAVKSRCPQKHADDPNGHRSPQEEHLNFGPRWRVLRTMAYGSGEGIAQLALPAVFRSDLTDGYHLHPALMDLATGWAMQLIDGYQATHLWVPVSYGSVQIFGPLPADIYSHVRNAGANTTSNPFASFDITLTDADGHICLEIKGFTIHRLEGGFAATKAPSPSEVEFLDGDPAADKPLSPAEERLQHNISQGIQPAEGADAFARAVSAGMGQVVISSLDLPTLIAQANIVDAGDAGDGQKFQRPELDSEYVAPSTDIERTLVGFWEDLLGVDQVGVADSFFDLGGHSLIAVRLFAMIKKAYRTEFPISVLFEAPTIAQCAALIAERTGGDTDTDGAAEGSGQKAAPKRRFTHLVAMHKGEGGPKTPFFLVAGMFGNVLNLRHLAHLIGQDRPFYGLQARGLLGDEPPHETLAEAAADMIKELQQVQPHGPYMLGGFSGGGLTAYEMAHQLEAMGETVSVVVMLDTPLPMRPVPNKVDKALIKLHELRAKGPKYFIEWAKNRIAWELGKKDRATIVRADDNQFQDAAIEAAFYKALPQFDLRPWDGTVALFRPPLDKFYKVSGGKWISAGKEYVFEDNDWGRWLSDLEVIEVPGDHDSMVLEPNVRVLATKMKAIIVAAEADEPVDVTKMAAE